MHGRREPVLLADDEDRLSMPTASIGMASMLGAEQPVLDAQALIDGLGVGNGTQETGLTRWEQETARRALRQAGLLEEWRVGMPAKLWFRVCPDAILRALQASVAHQGGDDGWGHRG